ncbi:acetoacetate decarboxylase family protein [Pseudoalteromonas sp. SR44-5]|uniref:acetoacetate decarboxylase family protein n=1 Tax=unclassified Pseudoalteromonas TaxID=194690 RepID=UPI0015FF2D1B|nr:MULTISPECIES: acetoacetate decarboxylase family protein [unclassified Pseudoalteromonas]MBB1332641.1 acetoacetate decarboxylase family protein [Pseudoalteromonas sp. SR41-6]MBB1340129.1 acetoacetate decarboxylase family protein [Pseudoalteromonas sp. SR45-6]MBB1366237.1 acetoacetate decarboxylase family protein [Pseudoalteromonas sp. SR44-5]MBB1416446.1 acetoacetate decarboxylase family protein [Pseudoalteromonas sp. SG44-1]MBB1423106.1 acetoacetate decarboxylase family protein [Pseudoalter
MTVQLPPYSHFLSNPVAKPPCRMTNANMYGFFAKIDQDKVQQYIDTTLNIVATDELYFKGIGEYALLTFTDIEKIASLTPPFSEHGWMQETDIIIWLPVAKVEKQGNDEDITHLYWYPAFICVNNVYALINGRETWGYNKYLCDYQMPSSVSDITDFSVSLDCFKHFSPTSKLQSQHLFSVTKNVKTQSDGLLSVLEDFGEHVANLFDGDHIGIDFSLLKQLLQGFVNPQMDQILFKQLPDGQGDKAVFQAVMHSPSEIKKIHQFKLLSGAYQLHLQQLDSFPLAQMFGLQLGAQAVYLPFYIKMDFDQLQATQILPK